MKTVNSFLPDPAPMYSAKCDDGSLFFDDVDMLQICRELGFPLYIRYAHYAETVKMMNDLEKDYDDLRVKYENLLAMIMGSSASSDETNLRIKEYLNQIKE